MSSSSVFPAIGYEVGNDTLSAFARKIFSSMPRVDQRRWAEVYLRGLLYIEGRKSVRKMAEGLLSMPVNQSLQQFINQSPWDWTPIRARLAQDVAAEDAPQAWVINRAVIPKRGSHSVGVVRQFVPEAGKTVNCQIGVGLFLTNATTVFPVNWRLLLKGKWAHDERERAKVYLPDNVQAKPEWAEIVSLVDETARDWGIPPAPVVADLSHSGSASSLARALHARGVEYILKVDESFRPLAGDLLGAPDRGRSVKAMSQRRAGHRTATMTPPLAPRQPRSLRDQFVSVLAPLMPRHEDTGNSPVVRVIGQHPQRGIPRGPMWITSLTQLPLDEVMYTASLANRGAHAVRLLEWRFGLQDFEGRSFRGWHHHMTMMSAAWIFGQLHGWGLGE